MQSQEDAIIAECLDQAEHCRYTAAAMYAWLHKAIWINRVLNSVPILLGCIASYSILKEHYPIVASLCALAAGVLPAIYDKLQLKAHTDQFNEQVGAYKNLEHKFNQAASITALDADTNALKIAFQSHMESIESLRAKPLIIPERIFQLGKTKVDRGDYTPNSRIA